MALRDKPHARLTKETPFARELSRDASGDLGDAAESPHGVVARRDVRPAEMKDVKLSVAAGAVGFHVHPLEQIGIAFRVDDDHNLVIALAPSTDVLGDEEFGESCLADACGTEDERVTDAFTQRERDVDLVGLDTMQPR